MSLGRQGLPASEARALAALAGDGPLAPAAEDWVRYGSLPSGARALLADAVRREAQLLGSSLEGDEALLSAWEKLPSARASAEAQRERAAEAEARAAAAEAALERARAAAAAASEPSSSGSSSSAPGAAGATGEQAGSEPRRGGVGVAVAEVPPQQSAASTAAGGGDLESPTLAAASARAVADSEAERLAAAESKAAALAAAVEGVRRVAVQYRAAKKRVLAEALSLLEA